MQALRHIRQIAHESSGEMPYGGGRQPAVLRTFSQRLSRFVAMLLYSFLAYHGSARVWKRSPLMNALTKVLNIICRGFNDAVNGFLDDGWSLMSSDGTEDVTIAINSSPNKLVGSHVNSNQLFSAMGGGVLCAKASMLLQVSTHKPSVVLFSINNTISC